MQFACPKKTSLYTENTSINLARFRQNLHTFAEKPSSCYAVTTFEVHPPTFPHKQQVATQILEGKNRLRDRSRIKKLAQVSAKFWRAYDFGPRFPLKQHFSNFFCHCTQVRLDESERQRSAASVVRANLDVVARYPSHFVPGSMLKHFVAFFQPDSHYLTPSIKTLLFIIRSCLI